MPRVKYTHTMERTLKLKTMITREGRGKNEGGKGIQESSMEGVRVGQNLQG